ncbi:MAG: hypothetical protein JSV27_05535 [Candidatus Bathyarchaeota archaeon]|nr:MAG: hypothetical protein JSV27_05535 [Candidatus Bathyarchaeota archaeon]
MGKGFNVVFEGKRYLLRVYRRYIYPVPYRINGEEYMLYSDTGREIEINYERAEDYDLDDPFKRMALMRLAKAMNCLDCVPFDRGQRKCRVTICTSEELHGQPTDSVMWVPFDPERMESLDDRIMRLREKLVWENRI